MPPSGHLGILGSHLVSSFAWRYVTFLDSAEADLASPLKVDGGGLDVGPLLPKVLASLPTNNQSSIDDQEEAQIRINLDSARYYLHQTLSILFPL